VFEGVLLMRITTVACVTEQNDFSEKNRRNQLLRTVFDRYNLIRPTIRHHDPSDTLHIINKQRNVTSDSYEAPPQKRDLADENSYYTSHSVATSSFTPRYALTIPVLHFIQQQLAKRNIRHVRTSSLIVTFSPFFISTKANYS